MGSSFLFIRIVFLDSKLFISVLVREFFVSGFNVEVFGVILVDVLLFFGCINLDFVYGIEVILSGVVIFFSLVEKFNDLKRMCVEFL